MASPPIKFVHQNDVKWVIQLWLAKHGGDPGPELDIPDSEISAAATQIIRKLAVHLEDHAHRAVVAALGH